MKILQLAETDVQATVAASHLQVQFHAELSDHLVKIVAVDDDWPPLANLRSLTLPAPLPGEVAHDQDTHGRFRRRFSFTGSHSRRKSHFESAKRERFGHDDTPKNLNRRKRRQQRFAALSPVPAMHFFRVLSVAVQLGARKNLILGKELLFFPLQL